jgi:hypothetical protein
VALSVLVFHVPISGHCGLKVRGRRRSSALPDRPLERSGPSGDVTDRPRLGTGLSVMRSMGSRACPLVCACPPVPEVVIVTFSVSPPSGVFSATTFLQEILLFPSASRALSMMTSLSLPLSAVLGQIRIFFSIEVDHIHWEGLCVLLKFQSSLVNGRLNLSLKHITIISGIGK